MMRSALLFACLLGGSGATRMTLQVQQNLTPVEAFEVFNATLQQNGTPVEAFEAIEALELKAIEANPTKATDAAKLDSTDSAKSLTQVHEDSADDPQGMSRPTRKFLTEFMKPVGVVAMLFGGGYA